MEIPRPYRGWKRYAAAVLRFTLRTYIRFVPWSAFKMIAYEKFDRYVSWLPYSVITRTRYGFRMVAQVMDLVSSVIYLTGQWEPYLTAYVRRRLRPGDVFVDIGANIGYYSLLASRLVGGSGRVYSVEASTSIYSALLRNIELNGCENIVPINAAASDAAGELVIWLADERNRGRSTTVAELAATEGMKRESTVRADTIDRLVGPEVLRRARLVKIDVEGAERTVLAPLLISSGSLGEYTEWLIELTPGFCKDGQRDADWIFESFVAMGYSAYVIPNSYSIAGWLANTRTADLTRVMKAPEHQADVLFRREASVSSMVNLPALNQ
jgi:FkbM family methyltransferase